LAKNSKIKITKRYSGILQNTRIMFCKKIKYYDFLPRQDFIVFYEKAKLRQSKLFAFIFIMILFVEVLEIRH